VGGALKFGYPVFDYTRLYMGYSYEVNDLYNMDEAYLSESTIELKGKNVTQSITSTIHLDSRDRANNAQATEGSDCAFSVEYAGGVLGGEIGFTKYKLTAGRYIPMPLKLIGFPLNFIGFLHAEGGYIRQNDNDTVPDYETFYLGGMNSVRGFDYNDICLTETRIIKVATIKKDANDEIIYENGEPVIEDVDTPVEVEVGGEKYMQYNAELLLPLFKTEGFLGLVFFDMGNVYDQDSHMDFGEMRKSWGFGIRWFSPIGPIRFERGHIIDPKDGESRKGKWDFTMGGTF
jgi:outer membrane protein insertion porin family